MDKNRSVFFISDGTGITAETLGHSLLCQFPAFRYQQRRMPFIDTVEKARGCVDTIRAAAANDGVQPIVISTLVDSELSAVLKDSGAAIFDFFATFIAPMEAVLGTRSSHTVGGSHGGASSSDYAARIEAINFTLAHDDGVTDANLEQSDVILVGVSRSGKTPTSLYLALQFGMRVANYPLIPEDFERNRMPDALAKHRHKLFGLTIAPERLASIRQERRPDSKYASIDNCRWEIDQAQKLMRREGIRWLDSTTKSIEEISATLMQTIKLERRAY